jgi:hypothetical protein
MRRRPSSGKPHPRIQLDHRGKNAPWPPRLGYLVSDTSNPQRPAPLVRPLDVRADATSGDGQLVVLFRPGTASPAGFQHIPETKSGQNRLRLGQVGDDLDAATADAETLGGRWPEPGQIPRARRNVLPVPGGAPCPQPMDVTAPGLKTRYLGPKDGQRLPIRAGCWPAYGRMNQTCDQGASPCCAWPFQHPQRGGCVATPGCLTWIAGAALPGRGTVTAARSASAASKPG